MRGRIQSSGKQEEAGVRCCARDAMTPACSNGDGSAFAGCRSSFSLFARREPCYNYLPLCICHRMV
jgi:hypothetical protein